MSRTTNEAAEKHHIKPYDIYKIGHDFWEVEAVCLGGIGTESIVVLKCLTKYQNVNTRQTYVPLQFFDDAQLYTPALPRGGKP